MNHYNRHFCNPIELLSKSNIWECIRNCNVLTEIINVFEFCDMGWMVQSLPLNILKKFLFTWNNMDEHSSWMFARCCTKPLGIPCRPRISDRFELSDKTELFVEPSSFISLHLFSFWILTKAMISMRMRGKTRPLTMFLFVCGEQWQVMAFCSYWRLKLLTNLLSNSALSIRDGKSLQNSTRKTLNLKN